MSPPYRQHAYTPHHHPHDDGRQMPRRPPSSPARNTQQPRSNPHSYALVHHGKQVRVGPVDPALAYAAWRAEALPDQRHRARRDHTSRSRGTPRRTAFDFRHVAQPHGGQA